MHRIASRASALLLCTSVAFAGGDPADREWLQLDAELARLANASGQRGQGFHKGVLIRTFYAYSEESIGQVGGEDQSGFDLDDTLIWVETEVADFALRVSMDVKDGEADIEDAHAIWRMDETMHFKVGQFRPRVLFSNSVDEDRLMFQDRTLLGALFDDFSVGAELWWRYDQFDFITAITNGDTGVEEDHFYVARLEWALYDGPWEIQEGSRGAPDHLRVLFGGVYFIDNTNTSENRGGGCDLAVTLGPTSLAAEVIDSDDGFGGGSPVSGLARNAFTLDGSATSWSVTAGHFLTEDVQAAVRYQEPDDSDESKVFSAALDWYHADGVSWVLDVTSYDKSGDDGIVASIGLNVGRAR